MPLELSCPSCEKVFAVTEARHPVGVQCPACDTEVTAEFRRVPVPAPGESPYELLVTPGRPKDAAPPPSGKRPLPLDDEERGGGGSVAMVVVVAVTALVLTLSGLGATGYFLFTNLDPPISSRGTTTPSTFTGRPGDTPPPNWNIGNQGGNKGPIGGGNLPGGGIPGVPNQPKKADRFSLNPVTGPAPVFTPTQFDASGSSAINLPGKAESIAIGGGGRYVVLHFPAKGELAVVDVCQAKIVAQKEADGGGLKLAAGLNRLVVWAPVARMFRVYDLPTLEKLDEFKCELFHGPQHIGMGNRTNGPLLAIDPFGEVVLHDVNTKGGPAIEASQGRPGVHAGHGGGIRASSDGKTFSTFDGFEANHKVILLSESVGKWRATKDTYPAPFPSERGDLFFGNGGAMDRNGNTVNIRSIGFGSGQWFIPATSGTYLMKITTVKETKGPRTATFTLTVHRNRNVEAAIPVVQPIANIQTDGLIDPWGNPVALDQHFILVPDAKVLVFIPGTKDRVHFRHMDLR